MRPGCAKRRRYVHHSIQITVDLYGHLIPGETARPRTDFSHTSCPLLPLLLFKPEKDCFTGDRGRIFAFAVLTKFPTLAKTQTAGHCPPFFISFCILELGRRDSNPDKQIQSLRSYRWTTSQQQTRKS